MDLYDCKKKGFVKEIKKDTNKKKSFLKIAFQKEKSALLLPEEYGESKITLMYDALRILLEAIAIEKGFKIYNHECYTSFIREVLNESWLADEFDKFRKIRNAINYYAKEISKEEAENILCQMQEFIKKIK